MPGSTPCPMSSPLKVSNSPGMALAGLSPSPAWPGGVQDTSTGHQAEDEPHLCPPWPVLGCAEPCKWGSSPKAPCLPKDQRIRETIGKLYFFEGIDLTTHKPHLHRPDIESLQRDQRKPLICVLWEHCLCLSSHGALDQIFLLSRAPKKPLNPAAFATSALHGAPPHVPPEQQRLSGTLESTKTCTTWMCGWNPAESVFESPLFQGCCLPCPCCPCPTSSALFLWGELCGLWEQGVGQAPVWLLLKAGTGDILLTGTFFASKRG